ncbi:hypothetical protein [Mesorhizobium sp. M2A.F.Ca.ET.043.02.1.1]|nr:hypothetical protein [Mesorhizobium sp. M2A.F.Ca.ET.043.02.1.1]
MEPVLAQTTGFFRERPAAGVLADAFSAVWVHRMDERAVPPIVITPDATIDLQWIDAASVSPARTRSRRSSSLPLGR